MADLEWIYRQTLKICAPDRIIRRVVSPPMMPWVVAIGKSAGPLLDGFAGVIEVEDAIAAIPRGYPPPKTKCSVFFGGHPQMDDGSFRAGRAILDFAKNHGEVTFLVSGGGSACAEVPLEPFFDEHDLTDANDRLIAAGIPIADINTVRKHLSALKGGRLAARAGGECVTLVYSDVATGDLASVASGPTLPDRSTREEAIAILERIGGCDRIVTKLRDLSVPETVHHLENARPILVADNGTLVDAAAMLLRNTGAKPVRLQHQIEGDVADAARDLAARAASLEPGEVLVAGGEPTVRVHGSGRGGRCLELAVRFALECNARHSGLALQALFGSSDGVDGNSGVAGAAIALPASLDRPRIDAFLAASDSLPAAAEIGRPIIIPATGNNLRDLYLVART